MGMGKRVKQIMGKAKQFVSLRTLKAKPTE